MALNLELAFSVFRLARSLGGRQLLVAARFADPDTSVSPPALAEFPSSAELG